MEDIRFDGSLEFSISNVGYVNVLRNENFTFEYKNGKEFYSFIYVENGELEYHIYPTKEKMVIKKGMLLFMPKQLPYRTRYLKDQTKIKIINFNFSGKNLPFQTSKPFCKSSPEISESFKYFSTQNYNILFLYSKIYELFCFLKHEKPNISKKFKKILPSVKDIEKNFFENKKILFYADLCNMSESNFRKVFKEYTGFSPIEYRNIMRCKEVKQLLDSGEFTVSEAAYTVGFNNMSFFYEVYNKYINA